ncbi:hypothetical protein C8Q73DRAFT_790148 [Cubamyces lactineus]|nr:hypothetical protein C8Q73DRAFT_790148 [Cubamyces lactineus]
MESSLILESAVTQTTTKPPRPRNSFLIYRSFKLQELQGLREAAGRPALMMGEASKIIGKLWRQEPIEVTSLFEKQAEEEKAAHAAKYPGYKYHPRTKAEKAKEREAAYAARNAQRRKQRAAPKRVKRQDSMSSTASTDSENSLPHTPISSMPVPNNDFVPLVPYSAMQGLFMASAAPSNTYCAAPSYPNANSGFPISWWGTGIVPPMPPFMQAVAQGCGIGPQSFYPMPSPDEVQPAVWPENIDPLLSPLEGLSIGPPLSLPTEFQMPDPRSAYQWVENGGQAQM